MLCRPTGPMGVIGVIGVAAINMDGSGAIPTVGRHAVPLRGGIGGRVVRPGMGGTVPVSRELCRA